MQYEIYARKKPTYNNNNINSLTEKNHALLDSYATLSNPLFLCNHILNLNQRFDFETKLSAFVWC